MFKRIRTIFLIFLSQFFLLGLEGNESEYFRGEPNLKPFQNKRVEHMGLYFDGVKSGWVKASYFELELDGKPALAVRSRLKMQTEVDGEIQASTTTYTEYFASDPPHAFLLAKQEETNATFSTTTKVIAGESDWSLEITTGQKTRKSTLPSSDYCLGDFLASEIWMSQKLEVGDQIKCRAFDIDELKMTEETHRIVNVTPSEKKWDPVYAVKTANDTGIEFEILCDGRGRLLSLKLFDSMELRRESRKNARDMPESGIDFFAQTVITPDRPLFDPSTISGLILRISGDAAKTIKAGPMQTVDPAPEEDAILLRTGKLSGNHPVLATEEELASALEATAIYPHQDEMLMKLGNYAVGDAKSDRAKVKRLVSFVSEFIDDDFSAEPPTIFDLVEARVGDCTEHAQLFVTLARAMGIPAREITGLVYSDEPSVRGFAGHAWAEVAVDGQWFPVDPTWDETTLSGTHIRFEAVENASSGVALLFGKLKIEVVQESRFSSIRGLLDPLSRSLIRQRTEGANIDADPEQGNE